MSSPYVVLVAFTVKRVKKNVIEQVLLEISCRIDPQTVAYSSVRYSGLLTTATLRSGVIFLIRRIEVVYGGLRNQEPPQTDLLEFRPVPRVAYLRT
ncbi:unnamed protein product [Nesidiocoris tenuis]|uniref:Uncharacterized protein n=1 Tax=Nesidiocoris tenuis TaxID=355587 RepID=A0A6H5HJN6_9HEMI|nr:unnamed protein product [Nesidiocoris tenuis]